MIGRTIGKYQIIDKLGEGGMGSVYKAEDKTLECLVTLEGRAKVMDFGLAQPAPQFIRQDLEDHTNVLSPGRTGARHI